MTWSPQSGRDPHHRRFWAGFVPPVATHPAQIPPARAGDGDRAAKAAWSPHSGRESPHRRFWAGFVPPVATDPAQIPRARAGDGGRAAVAWSPHSGRDPHHQPIRAGIVAPVATDPAQFLVASAPADGGGRRRPAPPPSGGRDRGRPGRAHFGAPPARRERSAPADRWSPAPTRPMRVAGPPTRVRGPRRAPCRAAARCGAIPWPPGSAGRPETPARAPAERRSRARHGHERPPGRPRPTVGPPTSAPMRASRQAGQPSPGPTPTRPPA